MTGRDLLSASFRLLGVLASGESMDAQEATDGLSTLNRLLDSWSNEELLIYKKVEDTHTLTANVATYTMGSGATINTARPMRIENALIRDSSVSPAVDYPMLILTKEQWANISVKQVTSSYPRYLYPEGTYPNETLNLYPMPSAAHTLLLYSWKPLTTISTLDTSISFPPGYERALVSNLAIDLAPEYGRQVGPELMNMAMESKAAIKRSRFRPDVLYVDEAISPVGAGFNIYTGGPS